MRRYVGATPKSSFKSTYKKFSQKQSAAAGLAWITAEVATALQFVPKVVVTVIGGTRIERQTYRR